MMKGADLKTRAEIPIPCMEGFWGAGQGPQKPGTGFQPVDNPLPGKNMPVKL
jgi:hypothetical protein